MTGSKVVPSIKNTVREICISSCEGKYPGRDNGKLFSFKSQKGRLRVHSVEIMCKPKDLV